MPSAGEAQFEAIYGHHHRAVFAYCRRRSNPDEVEDLVAEVFTTVWRKIQDAPQPEDVLPWLYRISYLVMTNHWRSAGRRKKLTEKIESLGVSTPALIADQIVVRQELSEVLEAAERLKPRDQEILRLASWERLSSADIGSVLDITPNTAKQRLHRARKALIREHERIAKRTQPSPAAQEGGEW